MEHIDKNQDSQQSGRITHPSRPKAFSDGDPIGRTGRRRAAAMMRVCQTARFPNDP
jgi:hypothetical protein